MQISPWKGKAADSTLFIAFREMDYFGPREIPKEWARFGGLFSLCTCTRLFVTFSLEYGLKCEMGTYSCQRINFTG